MVIVVPLASGVLILGAQILTVTESTPRPAPVVPVASVVNGCESAYPAWLPIVYPIPTGEYIPPERWDAPLDWGMYVHEVWCQADGDVVWIQAPTGTRLLVVAWAPGAPTIRCTFTVGRLGCG